MIGKHSIRIGNSKLRYEFTINRNITVLKGDSATGKTTLVEMIREYYENGNLSGITLESDVPCRTLEGRDWSVILPTIENSIIFIDEENDFLRTIQFAEAIQKSSNYYVLVTREGLPYLPYSVDEIYGIRESGKYAGLKHVYNEFYRIYHPEVVNNMPSVDCVIVEDTNSGFDFFASFSVDGSLQVVSSEGKSGVFSKIMENEGKRCLVVADGAAFGSEIDRVMKRIRSDSDVILYLPESFEWLLLKSGLIDGKRVQSILQKPEKYIRSEDYFSWERFFTALIIEETKDTYMQYSKKKLNPVFLHDSEKQKILTAMERAGELIRHCNESDGAK